VRLFLSPATEYRADRALLETARIDDPRVAVRVHCVDGDLLSMEVALHLADAWHEQPEAAIAVVSDANRCATLVGHYEGRPGRRPPWLLHLHPQPPKLRSGPGPADGPRLPSASGRLRPRLDGPSPVRAWNRWDRRVWALRRLAGRTDATLARRSLHPGSGQRGDMPWHEANLDAGVRLEELDRVDNLIADLWRLNWGDPFTPSQARGEAARRMGIGEADCEAVLDALLVAQLLRWHDPGRLEVPAPWREGLLLPMRRVVLRLARRRDLTYPLDKLIRQHNRRFLGRPAAAAPGDAELRRVEYESRVDSWRWVRWALLDQLREVEERTNWRPGGATWTLVGSRFAKDAVATTECIRRELEEPVPVGRLETALEQDKGIVRPGRWLRCLRDVGLVTRRAGHWELVDPDDELHLP
jgi:hypothetical protein